MPSTTTSGAGMDERRDAGRAVRDRVPRRALGEWGESRRTHDALPRWSWPRAMTASPSWSPSATDAWRRLWTHYRGAAAVMAADLATADHSGLEVQLCGDAHPELRPLGDARAEPVLRPAGLRRDPARALRVGRAAPGGQPRGARPRGRPAGRRWAKAAVAMGKAYRLAMRRAASKGSSRSGTTRSPSIRFVDFFVAEEREEIVRDISVEAAGAPAGARPQARAGGRRGVRIVEDPPFRVRVDDPDERAGDAGIVEAYRASLPEYRRHLLDRFTVADVARQVVGVGSVGMQVFLVLFEGRNGDDPSSCSSRRPGAPCTRPISVRAHIPTTASGSSWAGS